ncbi:putative alpha-xylosidase [Mollisia scopiformis]|uniref:alpha-glucosidase n=1 Tax=Mollisia scopiformis TaxID=149040 RepID=A0A132B6Q3_MOLSC|nr:putative alpha-xylosidase [Mollisia scopiformis]KUJ08085.1 putative alpha-xylosidase [Mollisia scopiformis]
MGESALSPRSNFPVKPIANPQAIVGGGSHKYRFTVLTDGLLRYEWAPDTQFEDRASVFAINRDLPVPEFRIINKNGILEIITQKFHLTYEEGHEFSASSLSAGVNGNFSCHSSVWHYGEVCGNMGGTARTLDEVDGRCALGPGVVSRNGYTTIDDSVSMLFDGYGFVATRRPGAGRVDGYLFAYGHDYAGAVKALYALSENQPLLPRWALGNWWSRYYAYSDKEYLTLMDKFEEEKIPFSVAVIDMDWHITDDPKVQASGKTGWTGYTWNKKLFPDPKKFLSALHEKKLRVTVNDHPADGVQNYEDLYPAMAKALSHSTENNDPIHFDITDRNFLNAFFDVLHRPIEDQGVDFWWVDWQQGSHSRIPGIDPLWVLNHFHFLDNALHHERPLTFSRYAGPGSHRYPVGFSGDTIVTWDSLAFQPEFTATASNIGYGWWSHDIGGHMGGVKDDEMATRWLQFGCFSPILRLHSSVSQWTRKEPWTYGVEAEKVMTEFLRFRHRLIPYLYTMNVKAATEGIPLVRPMYWEYPEEDEAYKVPNQYLFGTKLIVIPITAPQDPKLRMARTKGWLPPGRYVDIFSGAVYEGDRFLSLSRKLDQYPVLAKSGSIIPLDASTEPGNGGENPDSIEILVVIGADGEFELIEDDGTGSSAKDCTFKRTSIKYTQADGTLSILSSVGHSEDRVWTVRFLAFRDLNIRGKQEHFKRVNLGKVPADVGAKITLGPNPELIQNDVEAFIRPILVDAQIRFDLKEDIWKVVAGKAPVTQKVSSLLALEMSGDLRDAVLEYVLA